MRIEGQTMGGRATSYSRPVDALDYDFNLSKLERMMFGTGKVAALGHELERARAEAHDIGEWEDFGRVGAA